MEFRGAVVEDLQLPPPLPIYSDLSLEDARELVLQQWPWAPPIVGVLDATTHRVVGYLTGSQLESELADDPNQLVNDHMYAIKQPSQVSIATPLESLVEMLADAPLVEVLDQNNKHVLAIITVQDAERRGVRVRR